MAITNTSLIATAPTVVFTASGEQAITTIIFCNTSLTTDDIVTVWMVPATQPLDKTRMVMNEVSVPRGETFALDSERFVLANGDTIQAQSAQNNLITVTISSMATH